MVEGRREGGWGREGGRVVEGRREVVGEGGRVVEGRRAVEEKEGGGGRRIVTVSQ